MRTAIAAALVSLSVVACMDADHGDAAMPPDASVTLGAQVVRTPDELSPGPGSNDCDLLPCTGACSLACDPEKMAEQYLPPGVCAIFACPLSDGKYMIVDVCHYH